MGRSYAFYCRDGEIKYCRNSTHLKWCQDNNRFVRHHVYWRIAKLKPKTQLKLQINNHETWLFSINNLYTVIDIGKLPLDIWKIIFTFLPPVRYTGDNNKLYNISKSAYILAHNMFEKQIDIYSTQIHWTDDLTLLTPEKLSLAFKPNKFEEIEKRLIYIFEQKHYQFFLNAEEYYQDLLTEEFSDWYLQKYDINQISLFVDVNFAILTLLEHVNDAKIIFDHFPNNSKHMAVIKDHFQKCYSTFL